MQWAATKPDAGVGMTVHFVGAGPGAADLLTVRAVALLVAAECASTPAPTSTPRSSRTATHGRTRRHPGPRPRPDHRTNSSRPRGRPGRGPALLGRPVDLLGDHEQTRRLDAHGVPWDVTPGVPAYAAAAAILGAELTVPKWCSRSC